METTKNEMDAYSKNFFLKLGNYLDTQLYYYGSIQRHDYFPGKSDIDVDLFTDNSSSTIIKLQNFFGFLYFDDNFLSYCKLMVGSAHNCC